MRDVSEIKEKLNTKFLGRDIIWLDEVRFNTRLYQGKWEIKKWHSSYCRKSNKRERNKTVGHG